VLDDYSSLRNIENTTPSETAVIYPIREALSWEPSLPLGLPGKSFQGDNFFTAPNLGPEVMITYYYSEDYTSLKEKRAKKEKALIKDKKDTPYPDYGALKAEKDEDEAKLIFNIKDKDGHVVKKQFKKPAKGLQRFHWDLRYTLPNPIDLSKSSFYNPWASKDEGTLAAPGVYTVDMQLYDNGKVTTLVAPVSFTIKGLENTIMPAEDRAAKVAFQKQVAQLEADLNATKSMMGETNTKLKYMKAAIERMENPFADYYKMVIAIEDKLKAVSIALNGDPVKKELDIDQPKSPAARIGIMSYEQKYTTSTPTKTHTSSYDIAREAMDEIKKQVENIYNVDVKQLEDQLVKSGAGYTPGRGNENKN
ncbi:MAG: hypothetical protein WBN17_04615, partial [Aureibaculum sp.]